MLLQPAKLVAGHLVGPLQLPGAKLLQLSGLIFVGVVDDTVEDDVNGYGFETELNLNFSSSFILSPGYEFNHLTFPDRETNNMLNIHAINLRGQIMISTRLSANFLVQYVNTEDDFIGNFRIRYNPREGNDFYLVYNDNRCFIARREIAGHPPYHARTIMLKYTHTFIL